MLYAFLAILGLIVAIALFVIGMGVYEYYVEFHQDREVFAKQAKDLHLMHLKYVNASPKSNDVA